jgi:hypothetical protein
VSGASHRTDQLRALLRYFALLAKPRDDSSQIKLDVTGSIDGALFLDDSLRWTTGPVSYVADLGGTNRLPHLSRLASLQTLHEGEQVLYGGWPWVAGTVEVNDKQVTVCLPVVEAPVEVAPNRLGLGYRVSVVGPPVPNPLLVGGRDLMEDIEEISNALGGDNRDVGAGAAHRARERLRVAAQQALRDHLGDVEMTTRTGSPTELRSDEGLGLVLGGVVYSRSGANPGTRAHDLLLARDLDLAGTALDALYHADSTAAPRPRLVIDTTPMTESQHQAVHEALNSTVTVVAGPPGTGKTHTAVAAALSAVGHDDSVLIATSSRFAADVVASRFRDVPGLRFFRFGSDDEPGLLQAKHNPDRPPGRMDEQLQVEIQSALQRELDLEAAMAVRQQAAAFGITPGHELDVDAVSALLDKAEGGRFIWGRLLAGRARRKAAKRLGVADTQDVAHLRRLLGFHAAESRIHTALSSGGVSLDGLWDTFEGAVEANRASGREWVAHASSPEKQSQVLAGLDTVLRSGPSTRRRKLAAMKPAELTDSIPLWIGTLAEINEYLPLAPAMFDLVIMDEASHTNQIDAIPAFVRAKRALVLGDPKQLRHVTFVGDETMVDAARTLSLPDELGLKADVRRNSAFDLAATAAPTIWLSEHHRSVPHLIDFSAQRFYDDLIIMTRHPRNESHDKIHTVRVEGTFDRGVNHAEVDAVMDLIAELSAGGHTSIGVVTPFRKQADALERRILDEIDEQEIRTRHLRVGTVHGFQGNQRESMIISTVVSPDGLSSLRFVEDPNLFNVMVTRGQFDTWLVTSVAASDLGTHSLLAAYLRHAETPPSPEYHAPADPGWTAEVLAALRGYDLRVVPEYPVGPHSIDIVVGDGEAALGVETHVHAGGVAAHIARHLALRRAGWELIDAFESRWMTRPEAAAQHIAERALERYRA